MMDDRLLGDGDPCIREKDGRICCWLAGMSEEEENRFLEEHKGTYRSVGIVTVEGIG